MSNLNKTCSCGAIINHNEVYCPSCTAINLGTFWTAKNWHVSMHSDGNQFIAEINAGITGETYLSVGYSSPNYAWITKEMIPTLIEILDQEYKKIEEKDLEEMLPDLLNLCKAANSIYNKLIWENRE